MIRQLIAWANKRWPEVLTVTRQDYTLLREEIADLNRYAQGTVDLNNRLTALEAKVKQLQEASGFIPTSRGNFKLER